jgi:nitrogen fixation/metabolism regulation signal transduction histidine kinase
LKLSFSLQGKFIALIAVLVIGSNLLAVAAAMHFDHGWLAATLSTSMALVATVAVVRGYFGPIEDILRALRSGVASFKDHDYSVAIARTRDDELGELVAVYNELAATLRDERFSLFQRELLLDTVIQSSAVAVVITNLRDIIVFSNRVARQLMGVTEGLEGRHLLPLCEARSEAMAEQTRSQRDGLFTLVDSQETESADSDHPQHDVFHLTCRRFNLNGQIHQLYLYKQLTREIARQEVETWKKVIRVISHELNNSLAPISSLTNSARMILERGEGTERLDDIFSSISNRSRHLHEFIEQYARFARLPSPRPEPVQWAPFVADLERICQFDLAGELPEDVAVFDRAQMEQALINLLKNAMESGSPENEVVLRIMQNSESVLIAVEDGGPGMNEDQMAQALLPFYSTKRRGTGLGLPLCREIVEAHGGSFRLASRANGGLAAVCRLPIITEAEQPAEPTQTREDSSPRVQ